MTPTGNIQRPIGFKPQEISALVNREVVEQHAEEASFLWLLRDDAVRAPNYNLQDLADLDERVEANVDGLRVGGDVGWEYCETGLEKEEPGEVFAAAVIAFEGTNERRIQKVLEIACSTPELGRALGSALGWLTFEQAKTQAESLLRSEDTKAVRIGLTGFAVHRQDPGSFLVDTITSSDPHLRARALKAAGELGKTNIISLLMDALSDANETCKFYAAWSAGRLGQRNDRVITVLKEITLSGGDYCERAADMVMRVLDVISAKTWYRDLLKNPDTARCAVIGAGALGDPELIDDLFLLMEKEEVAQVAGETFSMITGVDIEYKDLDREEPEGFEGGPSEEADDEDVDMDPDEDLPWPNPELIRKWWKEHRKDFRSGVRYLRGKEMSIGSLMDALIHGEIRAPGKRQLKLLK
ncbi:MAG: TIGR02270 family protein [Deltaproteobacteria bacterium]|nr:TIGR02270 family protein [Deltaproteobacteria bacterium]